MPRRGRPQDTRAARRERSRQQREQLAEREGIDEGEITLQQRRTQTDTSITPSGRDQIRQNRASDSDAIRPEDLVVDDAGPGVDTTIADESRDNVAARVARNAAADSPLVSTQDVDVDVGARGIEDVGVDENIIEARQDALEQISSIPVSISGSQGDNDVPTADPALLQRFQALGDDTDEILDDQRTFVAGGAEFSLSLFPSENRVRPDATIAFENREDLRPFLDAVTDIPGNAFREFGPELFQPSEEVVQRQQDRDTRRSLRKQLDDALTEAGVDADADARADGTLIVADPDSGRTRTATDFEGALQGAAEFDDSVRTVERDGNVGVVDADVPTRDEARNEARSTVADDLGVGTDAIDIRDGRVAVERDALESTVRSSALENVRDAQTPVDPTVSDLSVQLGGENVDVRDDEVIFEEDAELIPEVDFTSEFEARLDIAAGDFGLPETGAEALGVPEERADLLEAATAPVDDRGFDISPTEFDPQEGFGKVTATETFDDPLASQQNILEDRLRNTEIIGRGEDYPENLAEVRDLELGRDEVLSTDLPVTTKRQRRGIAELSQELVGLDENPIFSLRRIRENTLNNAAKRMNDIRESDAAENAAALSLAGIAAPEPTSTVGGAVALGGLTAAGLAGFSRSEIDVPTRDEFDESELGVGERTTNELDVAQPRRETAEFDIPESATFEPEITTPQRPDVGSREIDVPTIEAQQQVIERGQQRLIDQERVERERIEIPENPFEEDPRRVPPSITERIRRDDLRSPEIEQDSPAIVDGTGRPESVETETIETPTFETPEPSLPTETTSSVRSSPASVVPEQFDPPRPSPDVAPREFTEPVSTPATSVKPAQVQVTETLQQALPNQLQQPTTPATPTEPAFPNVTVTPQRSGPEDSRRGPPLLLPDLGGGNDDEPIDFGEEILEETFDNAIASVDEFEKNMDDLFGR